MTDKLEHQRAALEAHSDAGLSYTGTRIVDADLRPLKDHFIRPTGPILQLLLTRGNVVGTPSTVIVERALLERVGGFDARFSQCADWELWLRLAQLTDFVGLEQPLVAYRTHGENMSRNVALLEFDSVLLLEDAFCSRRFACGINAAARRHSRRTTSCSRVPTSIRTSSGTRSVAACSRRALTQERVAHWRRFHCVCSLG